MNKNEIQDKLKQMEREMAALRKKLDEPELLPCPFCGSTDLGIETNMYTRRYRVNCNDCGAVASCGDTKEKSAIIWNRRSKDPREEAGEECKKIISKWIAKLEPGWKPKWKQDSKKFFLYMHYTKNVAMNYEHGQHILQDEWYFPSKVANNDDFSAEIVPHFRKWLGVE